MIESRRLVRTRLYTVCWFTSIYTIISLYIHGDLSGALYALVCLRYVDILLFMSGINSLKHFISTSDFHVILRNSRSNGIASLSDCFLLC